MTKHSMPPHLLQYITSLGRPPAIADLGTGTGIWLSDLAPTVPADSRLDGYDIDTSKFPDPKHLPPNVTLTFGNILDPFPSAVLGQYDLVHVHLLVYGLKADQWEKAAANVRTLLRPGGWLIWGETGYPSWTAMPLTERFSHWLGTEMRFALSVGRELTAPMKLLEHVSKVGFVDCSQQEFSSYGCDDEIQEKASLVIMRLAWQSLHGMVDRGGFELIQSHEVADEVVAGLREHVDNGVTKYGFSIVWVTGRNPEN